MIWFESDIQVPWLDLNQMFRWPDLLSVWVSGSVIWFDWRCQIPPFRVFARRCAARGEWTNCWWVMQNDCCNLEGFVSIIIARRARLCSYWLARASCNFSISDRWHRGYQNSFPVLSSREVYVAHVLPYFFWRRVGAATATVKWFPLSLMTIFHIWIG